MHLGHILDRLLKKAKAKFREFAGQKSTPQHSSAPPINTATKPAYISSTSYRHGTPYWRPTFNPTTPIWTYFEQETGATGWGNDEAQNYTSSPANSFFTPENKLVLRAISRPKQAEGKYTSARLVSQQTLDRDRGHLTARLSVPCAKGIWPAFWLLPAEPMTWPRDGEIDICESWNGRLVNYSCLHWGHHNQQDAQKHRVIETPLELPGVAHEFSLTWEQDEGGTGGRALWYLDAMPVMRAALPLGIRPLREFRIILNIAMGGNVCEGELPAEGVYDFVVHELKMLDEPPGGWRKFANDWEYVSEGKTM